MAMPRPKLIFWSANFSHGANLIDASLSQKFQDGGRILTGSSYNFATENDINVISAQTRIINTRYTETGRLARPVSY